MQRREFIAGVAALATAGPTLAVTASQAAVRYRYERWLDWLRGQRVNLFEEEDGTFRVEPHSVLSYLLNPGVPVGITDEDREPVQRPCLHYRSSIFDGRKLVRSAFYTVSGDDAVAIAFHPKLASRIVVWRRWVG